MPPQCLAYCAAKHADRKKRLGAMRFTKDEVNVPEKSTAFLKPAK